MYSYFGEGRLGISIISTKNDNYGNELCGPIALSRGSKLPETGSRS